MVSWTKDDEAINNYSWERLKTARKYLKIFAVSPEDTGVYVCKGTNGFGSEEIRINLIVIGMKKFNLTQYCRRWTGKIITTAGMYEKSGI